MATVGSPNMIPSSPMLDTYSSDLVWKSVPYKRNLVKVKSDWMWAGVLLKRKLPTCLSRNMGVCHPTVGSRTDTSASQEGMPAPEQEEGQSPGAALDSTSDFH